MAALGVALLRSEMTGQIMNVDSVLLNTVGVALAHVLVVPAVRTRLRRRADRGRAAPLRDDGALAPTPTIPRVGIAPWSDVSSSTRT
ncbi:VanZ family protein OS=Streptomyces antimycoticus OX=68175 GN=SANT12839_042420 PE=4 SV=1 [Streptomyces antimycoticus]